MSSELSMAQALCFAQDGHCFYCGSEFQGPSNNRKINNKSWTRDHMRSAANGHSRAGNIVLACRRCNMVKGRQDATKEEIARATEIWARACRMMSIFNGLVPHEWQTAPAKKAAELVGIAP
jgi:5-methylcytosine-specific restriction endonuclease McrA